MKTLVIALILILSLPAVYGLYEEVLEEPVILVDGAQLYFSKPFTVTEGTDFTMVLIPVIEEEGLDFTIDILKDGQAIQKRFPIVDVAGNQSLVVVWTDSIEEDTEYELLYVNRNGDNSRTDFTVQAQPKVLVSRNREEITYIPTERTQNQQENFVNLLNENGYDYSLGQFIRDEQRATELVDFEKRVYAETLVYNDNSSETKTVVRIDVSADDVLYDLKIIETVPKDMAPHVDDITFVQEPIVLEEDPIIMWHLEGVEDAQIEYSVDTNATVTGNTVLLTSVVDEQEVAPPPSKDVWIPIVIIPLIALSIIFFSRFSKKK